MHQLFLNFNLSCTIMLGFVISKHYWYYYLFDTIFKLTCIFGLVLSHIYKIMILILFLIHIKIPLLKNFLNFYQYAIICVPPEKKLFLNSFLVFVPKYGKQWFRNSFFTVYTLRKGFILFVTEISRKKTVKENSLI